LSAIDIFTDGSGASHKRPGVGGWAFVAFDRPNAVLYRDCGECSGDGLKAEIAAVAQAVGWFVEFSPAVHATVWCDNELVVDFLHGKEFGTDPKWSRLRAASAENVSFSRLIKRGLRGDAKLLSKMCHKMANQARKGASVEYLKIPWPFYKAIRQQRAEARKQWAASLPNYILHMHGDNA